MDPERAQFLFGTEDPGIDADDESELIAFFERELIDAGEDVRLESRAAMRAVVARQILLDEPPEAWPTVQRLRSSGLDRAEILEQMAFVVAYEVHLVLAEEDGDDDRYVSFLTRLPLPPAGEIAGALESAVAREQGVSVARACDEILDALGRTDDELAIRLFDFVMDQQITDRALHILAADRLVHAPTLTKGIVLTHRLNESEMELGVLSWVGSDLAGFAWCDTLSSPDGDEIEVFSLDFGHVGWLGPEGWLGDHTADNLIAVRVDDGVVRSERVPTEPAPDDHLVARLRALYDSEIDESGLPLLCEELVYAVLVDEPTTFDRPQPPLSELCERAGLELRGGLLGHDDSVWHEERRAQRFTRVYDWFDDDHERAREVLEILELADDPDLTDDQLRRALSRLLDDEIFWGTLDELVDRDDADDDDVVAARDFAARMVEVARTPSERMTAHFAAGVIDERAGDVVRAEAHFGHALDADAEWGPLVDRAAWYASDRGDARRAVSLWRLLESPDEEELRVVEACAQRLPAKRGRNDPCWCGSGRKLKTCHGDTPEPTPMPDRVEWLATKAVGFLLRHGGEAEVDVFDLAIARSAEPDDPDSVASALEDPIVLDVALTELGWFDRFLNERRPLLPDDEAQLAASWLPVDRTVYEVEELRPGDGMVVRDVRTGERLDVRERTFSEEAAVGQQFCARALPDGVTHQFVGAVFLVAPGAANNVLEICDNGDAFGLCRYVASLDGSERSSGSDVDDG